MEEKAYLCIDLKSFYASVEAVDRGLDPFRANLVVADAARGKGAICLAITPAMKALGIRNRCRLFEIPETVDYIAAKPRMKRYMEMSAEIYSIYLRYIAKEDILVYSIDECFFDITPYLALYGKTPEKIACMITDAVLRETGITASVGIGTNLFLAKVAMDITAKHAENHIGILDEKSFRETLWHHTPITDFWNIGPGIARRLSKYGIYDMYGVAHMEERVLCREFGINAEYLIDHAHGREPCTIAEIHAYTPSATSLSNGQILFSDYTAKDGELIVKEMADTLSLELLDRGMKTDTVSLSVGFSGEGGTGGSMRLSAFTDSPRRLTAAFLSLYRMHVPSDALVRRITLCFGRLESGEFVNYDMFSQYEADDREREKQKAILSLRKRFGKNAVVRGMNLEEKATGIERNKMIGGHRSGET